MAMRDIVKGHRDIIERIEFRDIKLSSLEDNKMIENDKTE